MKNIDFLGYFAWVRSALDRPSSRVLIPREVDTMNFERGEQHDIHGNGESPATAEYSGSFCTGQVTQMCRGLVPEKVWISTGSLP